MTKRLHEDRDITECATVSHQDVRKAKEAGKEATKNGKESKKAKRSRNAKELEVAEHEEPATKKRKESRKLQSLESNGAEKHTSRKASSIDLNSDDDVAGLNDLSEKSAAKAARKVEKTQRKALKIAEKQKKKGETARMALSTEAAKPLPDQIQPVSTLIKSSRHGSSIVKPPPIAVSEYQPRYEEHTELRLLNQSEVDEYIVGNSIWVSDPAPSRSCLRPVIKFSYLPSLDGVKANPFKSFDHPTPIQAATWPFLFGGRDVIGVAETGSGKTLAFAMPCVRGAASSVLRQGKGRRGAVAVIISPTRELAIQTYEQMEKVARPAGLVVACIYGGVQKDEQRRALRTASIVVATPGRLNDFINEGAADLRHVGYVVLDEADRMLDKGFEQEIRKIIGNTLPTPRRQTVMFTATWPPSVRELAATFMHYPIRVSVGDNSSGELRANNSITQKIKVIDPRNKEKRLLEILRQYQHGAQRDDRILVFCLYKKEATRVENFIHSKGFRVAGIHGDMSQAQRLASLEAFKAGKAPLLVATDVAARGLDIPEVKMVINVTFPLTVEDYVHRIGRTGRAGKQGTAITLFTEHDKAQAGALINVLKAADQPVPDDLLKFGTTVKKKAHDAYGAFYKENNGTKSATKIKFDD